MGSVKVTVFGRVKPCPRKLLNQEFSIRYGNQEDYVTFGSTRSSTGRKYYRFQKIFDEDSTQEKVFETVAKPVIEKVLLGYNGTIFTYGQTGSGKTYTMTGDIEKWIHPGLIPRTIQEIFKCKGNNTVISITYCEIYNEHVYDLIRSDKIDSYLPQVSLLEDSSGITHFRNLSVHTVPTVYEALQLLVRGDANKMVAETSSNAKSSRSHVIFSIALDIPHPSQEKMCLKPVLYLVDLAGSEKLSKGKSPMTNPWETRYINLSLHYLEQVLVALRQPGRVHIPYRNSLMTALLRNSLGGNCFTSMIATFSLTVEDIEETVQTCRFAERIGLIKNEVKLNEIANPQREIDSLKKQNQKLKAQLKLLSQDQQITEELNEEEKEDCVDTVNKFIKGATLELPLSDVRKMEYCFYLMRDILKQRGSDQTEMRVNEDTVSSDISKPLPAKSNDFQLDSAKLRSLRAVSMEKNWRRKRNTIDIPKVNITYKRWKSTEELTEENKLIRKEESVKETISTERESLEPDKKVTTEVPNESTTVHNPTSADTFVLAGSFLKENSSDVCTKSVGPEDKSSKNGTITIGSSHIIKQTDDTNPVVCLVTPKETASQQRIPVATLKKLISIGVQIEDESSESDRERDIDFPFDSENLDKDSIFSEESRQFSVACLPLTGDAEVDEEIVKFYKTRYEFFKKQS